MAAENGVSFESIDVISGLPNKIRELILGYLPITDAVRTSALSRNWRYSWKRVPQLNIEFEEGMEDRLQGDRYYRVVAYVLLSHVGTSISKFVLRIYDGRTLEGDLTTWVQLLSRKGIKELTIQSGKSALWAELPSSIFHCLGLSSLTLDSFRFSHLIDFKGFPNLISLTLFYVNIDDDMLEKIISSCPLEILVIEHCVVRDDNKVDINAPSLREFKIVWDNFYSCLSYTPNLKVANIWTDSSTYRYDLNFIDELGSMPKIEELTLCSGIFQSSASVIIPKKLSEPLVFLKTLTLMETDVTSSDQMLFISCVIRSSPNLQTLDVAMAYKGHGLRNEAALAFLKAEGKNEIESNISTLYVTFKDVELIRAEIALIDNIVSWCPAIGKLFIKRSLDVKSSANAKLQLSRAVRKYRHSSSRLKIIYL